MFCIKIRKIISYATIVASYSNFYGLNIDYFILLLSHAVEIELLKAALAYSQNIKLNTPSQPALKSISINQLIFQHVTLCCGLYIAQESRKIFTCYSGSYVLHVNVRFFFFKKTINQILNATQNAEFHYSMIATSQLSFHLTICYLFFVLLPQLIRLQGKFSND